MRQRYFGISQLCKQIPAKTAEQGKRLYLTQRARQAKQEDIVNDAGVAFRKTQELPELSSEQYPWKKDRDEKRELRAQRQPEWLLPTQYNFSLCL